MESGSTALASVAVTAALSAAELGLSDARGCAGFVGSALRFPVGFAGESAVVECASESAHASSRTEPARLSSQSGPSSSFVAAPSPLNQKNRR